MNENKKENRIKKLLIALLLIVVLGGSAVAFAWWDSLTVASQENNIVTLGEGLNLVVLPVEVDPLTDGNLIPSSAVLKPGDTYEIVLNYTVSFNTTVSSALNLSVTVSDIEVNSVANPYGLISVQVTNPGTIANSDVTVSLSVTIDDSSLAPEDYSAAYLALANNSISFNVTFEATAA